MMEYLLVVVINKILSKVPEKIADNVGDRIFNKLFRRKRKVSDLNIEEFTNLVQETIISIENEFKETKIKMNTFMEETINEIEFISNLPKKEEYYRDQLNSIKECNQSLFQELVKLHSSNKIPVDTINELKNELRKLNSIKQDTESIKLASYNIENKINQVLDYFHINLPNESTEDLEISEAKKINADIDKIVNLTMNFNEIKNSVMLIKIGFIKKSCNKLDEAERLFKASLIIYSHESAYAQLADIY